MLLHEIVIIDIIFQMFTISDKWLFQHRYNHFTNQDVLVPYALVLGIASLLHQVAFDLVFVVQLIVVMAMYCFLA
jgi:hypothetical protein